MTTTLKIDNAIARKAYLDAGEIMQRILESSFPVGFFSQSILERCTTFEQICQEAGKDIRDYELPADATEKQIRDMGRDKLELVYEVLNEGWEADYADTNQRKWVNWYKFVPGSGFALNAVTFAYTSTLVGARLSAKDEPTGRNIGMHFIGIVNEFFTGIKSQK